MCLQALLRKMLQNPAVGKSTFILNRVDRIIDQPNYRHYGSLEREINKDQSESFTHPQTHTHTRAHRRTQTNPQTNRTEESTPQYLLHCWSTAEASVPWLAADEFSCDQWKASMASFQRIWGEMVVMWPTHTFTSTPAAFKSDQINRIYGIRDYNVVFNSKKLWIYLRWQLKNHAGKQTDERVWPVFLW